MAITLPAGHVVTPAEWALMLSYVQPLFVRKVNSDTATADTGLDNDSELFLTVEANATYQLNGFLIFSAGTGDFKYGWTAPTGATLDWNMGGEESTAASTTGAAYWGANTISGSDIAGGINTATNCVARPEGLLRVSSTAGTFRLQWSQGSSDAVNATTLRAGSFITLRRMQ